MYVNDLKVVLSESTADIESSNLASGSTNNECKIGIGIWRTNGLVIESIYEYKRNGCSIWRSFLSFSKIFLSFSKVVLFFYIIYEIFKISMFYVYIFRRILKVCVKLIL